MKRKIMLTLVAALLVTVLVFAGCASDDATPTTLPSTEATTEAPTEATTEATEPTTEPPTEAPTEPQIINPLTGEVLETPLENRIVAVTINNVPAAMPHCGVIEADLFFEMFINDYATRGLALYTNIDEVKQIGSVRSLRYNFTDIAQGYDTIVAHAGGLSHVMNDAKNAGIDHMNIDTSSTTSYAFRDSSRRSSGYAWEHCLFVNGTGIYKRAESKGFRTTMNNEKDYGMNFTEDGTPAGGETAATVKINFIHDGHSKATTMVYDEGLGRYVYSQYGMTMKDGITGNKEAFENVFVILAPTHNYEVYHIADIEGSGEGYYACGGKIVPITWHRSGPNAAFSFTLADGSELQQGVGNSYIAIAPTTSDISWQ